MDPVCLHTFLTWVKDHRIYSVMIVFGYVCKMSLKMFGIVSIEEAFDLPRSDFTLYKNSKLSIIGLLRLQRLCGKMLMRADRFALDADGAWWAPGMWIQDEERVHERFFNTNPHLILDFSLDDLGAKEVDFIVTSLIEKSEKAEPEKDDEFERYLEERERDRLRKSKHLLK